MKNTKTPQSGVKAANLPIDTLSLTIHYPGREVDYIECTKLFPPIREKMFSHLKNHINLEVYKPKGMPMEAWGGILKRVLAEYGFAKVEITSKGTFRKKTKLFTDLVASLFDDVVYAEKLL